MPILKTYITDKNTDFKGHTAVGPKTKVEESKPGNKSSFKVTTKKVGFFEKPIGKGSN